jgi:hypothetical protein
VPASKDALPTRIIIRRDIPSGYFSDTVRDVCAKLNGLEFATFLPERAITAFEEILCSQADTRRALSHEKNVAIASSKQASGEKKLAQTSHLRSSAYGLSQGRLSMPSKLFQG